MTIGIAKVLIFVCFKKAAPEFITLATKVKTTLFLRTSGHSKALHLGNPDQHNRKTEHQPKPIQSIC
ncbi:MAG: hypothetical protein J6R91_04245 [Bacteroidaceae bacterium]|nr:hypothetical protein [Bacteroidaceae bacterium]